MLLMTGARRREITLAKWKHLDWEKRALLVPVAKSGRPRAIALNAAAFAVLKSIPRDRESSYVAVQG
jgi:integrase